MIISLFVILTQISNGESKQKVIKLTQIFEIKVRLSLNNFHL